MKKVLVTGGPVHKHLDDVKYITNIFRGGLIAKLAEELAEHNIEIDYLCAPEAGAKKPKAHKLITIHEHRGFDDYRERVLKLAPGKDGVVLGAAVANIIPVEVIKGKFPSHNFNPGDKFMLEVMIAPRVIDEVRRVAPQAHLFGYKLLSGASREELVRAAYGIVLEAKANTVFANDYKKGLEHIIAVTKERGEHPMHRDDIAAWIAEMLDDVYYSTAFDSGLDAPDEVVARVRTLVERYHEHFVTVETGLVFGTVAVRHGKGFVTTGRGKYELDSIAYVTKVDHENHRVYAANNAKASLNAPLLAKMFENPAVDHIVHYHEQKLYLPTYPYAPPGTVRDSIRPSKHSFNIKEHGCMLLFDKDGVSI